VVPGGVARDLGPSCVTEVAALLDEIRQLFSQLVELYDNTASLQDRTATTGVLRGELARQFGAGGYVGRASGRAFDARKTPGYPPYDRLDFEAPVFEAGDVNARIWVRIREVEQSLGLIDQILRDLPAGAIRTSVDHLVAQVNAANKNPRQADAGGGDQVNAVIPAKAGIHPSAVREVDQWIPAFAGTTSK